MKNTLHIWAVLFALAAMLWGCNQQEHIRKAPLAEKRQHLKGWHMAGNSQKIVAKKNNLSIEAPQISVEKRILEEEQITDNTISNSDYTNNLIAENTLELKVTYNPTFSLKALPVIPAALPNDTNRRYEYYGDYYQSSKTELDYKKMKSKVNLALILGVVGLITSLPIIGIFGYFIANKHYKIIKADEAKYGKLKSSALAAVIIGVINFVYLVLLLVLVAFILVILSML